MFESNHCVMNNWISSVELVCNQSSLLCHSLTFDNVFFWVKRDDCKVGRVQTSKTVDEMGAGEGINVVDTKVEGFWSVDRPCSIVAHYLVRLRLFH